MRCFSPDSTPGVSMMLMLSSRGAGHWEPSKRARKPAGGRGRRRGRRGAVGRRERGGGMRKGGGGHCQDAEGGPPGPEIWKRPRLRAHAVRPSPPPHPPVPKLASDWKGLSGCTASVLPGVRRSSRPWCTTTNLWDGGGGAGGGCAGGGRGHCFSKSVGLTRQQGPPRPFPPSPSIPSPAPPPVRRGLGPDVGARVVAPQHRLRVVEGGEAKLQSGGYILRQKTTERGSPPVERCCGRAAASNPRPSPRKKRHPPHTHTHLDEGRLAGGVLAHEQH
jgi:hypothetical protein